MSHKTDTGHKSNEALGMPNWLFSTEAVNPACQQMSAKRAGRPPDWDMDGDIRPRVGIGSVEGYAAQVRSTRYSGPMRLSETLRLRAITRPTYARQQIFWFFQSLVGPIKLLHLLRKLVHQKRFDQDRNIMCGNRLYNF